MLAKLVNMDRVYEEVTSHGMDCVAVYNADGKANFGGRTSLEPSEVNAYIRKTHADFSGEFMVEVWRKDRGKSSTLKYVVVGAGGGAVNGFGGGGGGIGITTVMELMQQNFKTQLEVERLKMEAANGAKTDYMPQAIAAIQQLLSRRDGNAPAQIAAPAPQQPAPAREPVNGDEDDEPDIFDEFAAADPEAEDVVERFLQLKVKDPAAYAQAKQMLKGMAS